MTSNAAHLGDLDLSEALAGPATTGNDRWDALLAGAVERFVLGRDIEVPVWTTGHALPQFWFIGSARAMQA